MAGRVIICPRCNERIEEKLKIEKKKLLIVEGRDEEELFGSMLIKLGIDDIQVAGIGGKEKLRPNLKALKETDPYFPTVICLGIVRDADAGGGDARGAFLSVQGALKNAGLPYPKKPMHQTIKGFPKVSVLILPRWKTFVSNQSIMTRQCPVLISILNVSMRGDRAGRKKIS